MCIFGQIDVICLDAVFSWLYEIQLHILKNGRKYPGGVNW